MNGGQSVTQRQSQVLAFVRGENPTHADRVAGEFGWRSQDAGRVLKSLERKGLIRFRTDPRPCGYVPILGRPEASDAH